MAERRRLGRSGKPLPPAPRRLIRIDYPEIRPENFGFCDACMNTMRKGKFRFLIKYGEGVDKKICDLAMKKFEMVAAKMTGRRVTLIKSNFSIQKQFFDRIYQPIYKKRHFEVTDRGSKPKSGRTSEDWSTFKKQGYTQITFTQTEPGTGEIWGYTTGPLSNITIRTTRDRNGRSVRHADNEIIAAALAHEFGHFLGAEKRDAFKDKRGGGHCSVPGCTMRHAVPGVMPEAIKNIYLRT